MSRRGQNSFFVNKSQRTMTRLHWLLVEGDGKLYFSMQDDTMQCMWYLLKNLVRVEVLISRTVRVTKVQLCQPMKRMKKLWVLRVELS